MKYKVRLMSTDYGIVAWVPSLPGCRAFGRTEQEALENVRSAIASYMEALEEQNGGFDCREVEVG